MYQSPILERRRGAGYDLGPLYLGLLMAADVLAVVLIPLGFLSAGPLVFWTGIVGVFFIGPLIHTIWDGLYRVGRSLAWRIGSPLIGGGVLFAVGWLVLSDYQEPELALLAASGAVVGFLLGLFADWHKTARAIEE